MKKFIRCSLIFNEKITYFKKIYRYIVVYGFRKTFFKIAARYRKNYNLIKPFPLKNRDIGIVGCGQFSFSTIGQAISRYYGNRFIDCYDLDPIASKSFSDFYSIKLSSTNFNDLINNDDVKYVYITSNHSTHSYYAIKALQKGKIVYIEKPISVSFDQLKELCQAIKTTTGRIYAGYNRPFSNAIIDLKIINPKIDGPLTINCHINGHQLGPNHWYRNPQEGTRICGNVGHWLDLAVHILHLGNTPYDFSINLIYSNLDIRDDNLAIVLTTKRGDLINITLTSRCDPFEGISEIINIQNDSFICKIDDFKKMEYWEGSKYLKRIYFPKDVGHDLAILQPFASKHIRDWSEVIMSTLLMLKIKDMIETKKTIGYFSYLDELKFTKA